MCRSKRKAEDRNRLGFEPSDTGNDFMTADVSRVVDETICSRRSVRAFLPTPVPENTVKDILRVASRAPSGTNAQPWRVYVLTGAAKTSLTKKVLAAFDDPDEARKHTPDYAYYPREWKSPYIERRRKVGWDLYGLLGIAKGEKDKIHAQHGRNYRYFDAPVGLVFTIDRMMEKGSWLDYGMFLQNIMIAARARGLDTCPQVAFNDFHRIIAQHLGLPEDETMVCSMSLGYADPDAIENQLWTERAPLEEWASFLGDGEAASQPK